MLHALVYGKPASKGSKKGFVKNGRAILVDADKNLKSWAEELKVSMARCRPAVPLDCPVGVDIFIFVRRPDSHYGSKKGERYLKDRFKDALPPSGVDVDKAARAVLDCLSAGMWITDDRRVTALWVRREYTEEAERLAVFCEPDHGSRWEVWVRAEIGKEASGG